MTQATPIVSLVPAATEWLRVIEAPVEPIDSVSEVRQLSVTPTLVVASQRNADVLREWNDRCETVVFEPATVKQVLDSVLLLARKTDRLPQAMRLLGNGEMRLRTLSSAISQAGGAAPTVAIVSCLDPVSFAEGWTAPAVELAHGRAVNQLSAEVIVVAVPNTSLSGALESLESISLAESSQSRMVVMDGSRYLTNAGPSIYRSIELLAWALFGERTGVTVGDDEIQVVVGEVSLA